MASVDSRSLLRILRFQLVAQGCGPVEREALSCECRNYTGDYRQATALVALWRYVTAGVVIEGAVMKTVGQSR